MCNPIHSLFGIEKVTKDFRGSNAAAKAWLRGGFRAPKQTAPPKAQKSSFYTVHKAMLRNRRATGARMGLVSKYGLVDIIPNSYAMSRCGLRKLYFGCKKVIFLCYFAVNRTHFSARLAIARWLLRMLVLCFGGAKQNFSFISVFRNNFTFQSCHKYIISIACFGTCLDLSQPPAFWWLTVQAGGREYPITFF